MMLPWVLAAAIMPYSSSRLITAGVPERSVVSSGSVSDIVSAVISVGCVSTVSMGSLTASVSTGAVVSAFSISAAIAVKGSPKTIRTASTRHSNRLA